MPKRTRKSAGGSARALLVLAAITVVLLIAGEAVLLSRSERWQLFAARRLGFGDPARITRLVGRRIHEGLAAAGVPRDSVSPRDPGGRGMVRWRVGIPPEVSLLQVNYAVTHRLREAGCEVLAGREHVGRGGSPAVTLEAGLPRRRTHEIALERAPLRTGSDEARGRLAVVVFGLGEDVELARRFLDLPLPFAVALVPGAEHSDELFRAAREREREVVLHVPLEPINFPQVNPGPGTIQVTMKPSRISGTMRRWLEEAGPVSAVANHMGSLATQDMTVMRAVYQELKRRRVPFLHVSPAAGAVCKPLASDFGVEYDQPDAILDAETRAEEPRALERRWREVLAEARRRGEMVVLVRATPLSREWLPRALGGRRLDDVSAVPLEALLRRPASL